MMVVQSWISANPVLKFKPVYFKTSEKKTPTDPEKNSEEIFLIF
jgi:hypothetical protein